MNLKELYYEVKAHMETLDFDRLWAGFQPLKFALYTDVECFFDGSYIPKTDIFLANTSICYNGERIAIWKVQEQMDTRILASKLVHEMFHGFQQLHKESRFPDEMDALYHYPYEEENLSLKAKENQILTQLVSRFDPTLFEAFLQLRSWRCRRFPYAFHYEASIEQIEGTANYVELICLKQLSLQLFEAKCRAMCQRILEPSNLLPIRIICYDIGSLLLLVIAQNSIPFDQGFTPIPFAEEMLRDVRVQNVPEGIPMGQLINQFRENTSRIIDAAVEKNDLVTDTPDFLLGVNIYNAISHRGYIISRFFVMFGPEDQPRIEYGDFVIESPFPGKLTRIYRI